MSPRPRQEPAQRSRGGANRPVRDDVLNFPERTVVSCAPLIGCCETGPSGGRRDNDHGLQAVTVRRRGHRRLPVALGHGSWRRRLPASRTHCCPSIGGLGATREPTSSISCGPHWSGGEWVPGPMTITSEDQIQRPYPERTVAAVPARDPTAPSGVIRVISHSARVSFLATSAVARPRARLRSHRNPRDRPGAGIRPAAARARPRPGPAGGALPARRQGG